MARAHAPSLAGTPNRPPPSNQRNEDASSARRRPSWWTGVRTDPLLITIVVFAAALRLLGLAAQSFWYDEFVTMDVVNRPLPQVLQAVGHREGTPPLYYVLLWFWDKVFGNGDYAVRSFSALLGIALIPIVYAIARQLHLTRRVARFAAFLAAANPMLVWYSQEARAYSLLALLSSISVLYFLRCRTRGTRADYLVWTLASMAAISTHYFAFLLVGAEAAWLLIERRDRRRALIACGAVAAVGLLLVPLLIDQRGTNQQAWIIDWPLHFRLQEGAKHLLVGPAPFDDRLWIIAATLGALAVISLVVFSNRAERRAEIVLVTLGGAGLVVPVIASLLGFDYFLDRNLIAVIALFTIIIAIGFGTQRVGWPGVVATVCLVAVFTAGVIEVLDQPHLQRADWRAVARVLKRQHHGSLLLIDKSPILGLPVLRYATTARQLDPRQKVKPREIDILFLGRPTSSASCSWWFGRACTLFAVGEQLPSDLATHYRLAAKRRAGQFLIARYITTSPVAVGAPDLLPPNRLGSGLVLWEPPQRDTPNVSS